MENIKNLLALGGAIQYACNSPSKYTRLRDVIDAIQGSELIAEEYKSLFISVIQAGDPIVTNDIHPTDKMRAFCLEIAGKLSS